MADDELDDDELDDDEGEEEEEGKSGGGLKLILISAGVLVLIVGGAGGAYMSGALDSLLGLESADEAAEKAAAEEAALPPVYYEFPELMVDLKQTTKKRRSPFLKIRVVAELAQKDEERLKLIEVKILDGFQTHLRGQTREDVAGKAGTDKLRAAFLDIVNNAMAPARIEAVLFRQIILQ